MENSQPHVAVPGRRRSRPGAGRWSRRAAAAAVLALGHLGLASGRKALTCKTGYGQRSEVKGHSIEHMRVCPESTSYCFEMTTHQASTMTMLVGGEWDDEYYDDFYIRGCGGEYGTAERSCSPGGAWVSPSDADPVEAGDEAEGAAPAGDEEIDRGDRVLVEITYCCESDDCTSGARAAGASLAVAVAVAAAVWL
jgi:hypothetical protein